MTDKNNLMHIQSESSYFESRVMEALKEKNGLTDHEIADAINTSFITARAIIQQLVYKGKVVRKRINSSGMQNYLKQ